MAGSSWNECNARTKWQKSKWARVEGEGEESELITSQGEESLRLVARFSLGWLGWRRTKVASDVVPFHSRAIAIVATGKGSSGL